MRTVKIAAALAAVVTLLTACTSGGSTTPTPSASAGKATLGLSYIPDIQFSPAYVAADKGFFSSRGADVTLRHHGASEGLFTALTAGQEDFVIAGADEMMQARSQGADLVAIAAYYRTYPVALVVPSDSAIRTIADLRGRSVGIPGKYGESWFGLKVALNAAGLTPTDVTIKEIGYTQQAAMVTRQVDSIIGFTNNDAVALERSGFPVRTIALAPSVPLISISLITTRAYLDSHPATAKAVADGLVAGLSSVVRDPAAAVETSVSRIPGLSAQAAKDAARATLDATIKVIVAPDGTVSGAFNPDQWTAMATFMLNQGLIATAVDPSRAFSNGFLSS